MPFSTELANTSARPETSGRSHSLLLIIPALNEELCIGTVVRRAREVLPSADVLVIDDGSTDGTRREAEGAGAFVVSHPFNLGIGGAVQTGLKFAQQAGYDYVMRIDADGQHDPAMLDNMLSIVRTGRADVVIGSRFLADHLDMKISLVRRIGIEVFRREVSLLTRHRVTDTTSGMIVMNRRAIGLLAVHMPQDYPEVEIHILLHVAGLRIEEVAVHMSERMAGVTSIGSWRSFYYAVKVSIAVLLTAIKDRSKLRLVGESAGNFHPVPSIPALVNHPGDESQLISVSK